MIFHSMETLNGSVLFDIWRNMKIVNKIVHEVTRIIVLIWMLVSFIPLFIGIGMIDILLRVLGINRAFLLYTAFIKWVTVVTIYLNNIKSEKENKENKNV